ncbi:MAG TPA: hypothetical protein VF646_04760 [Cytophagales bacterium]
MASYHYEFENFGLSENGFHLLRGRYCYQQYGYKDISAFKLKYGKGVRNWRLVLGIGVLLLVGTFFFYLKVFDLALTNGVHLPARRGGIKGAGLMLLAPLLPGVMGAMLVRQALKTCLVLEVQGKGFRKTCWLPDELRDEALREMMHFLRARCTGRVYDEYTQETRSAERA